MKKSLLNLLLLALLALGITNCEDATKTSTYKLDKPEENTQQSSESVNKEAEEEVDLSEWLGDDEYENSIPGYITPDGEFVPIIIEK